MWSDDTFASKNQCYYTLTWGWVGLHDSPCREVASLAARSAASCSLDETIVPLRPLPPLLLLANGEEWGDERWLVSLIILWVRERRVGWFWGGWKSLLSLLLRPASSRISLVDASSPLKGWGDDRPVRVISWSCDEPLSPMDRTGEGMVKWEDFVALPNVYLTFCCVKQSLVLSCWLSKAHTLSPSSTTEVHQSSATTAPPSKLSMGQLNQNRL